MVDFEVFLMGILINGKYMREGEGFVDFIAQP